MPIINPICHAMWSLTPYDKCDFRCVYCCTRVQGTSKPTVPLDGFLETFRRELEAIPADDLLIVGAFCDGYPFAEERLGLTRAVLDRARAAAAQVRHRHEVDDDPARHGRAARLEARPATVHLDLLDRRRGAAPPRSRRPSAEERFRTLHAFYEAGFSMAVNVLPWIPDVTDTAEIIARTPSDVYMVFAPLQFGNDRDSMPLLGRRYTRAEVVDALSRRVPPIRPPSRTPRGCGRRRRRWRTIRCTGCRCCGSRGSRRCAAGCRGANRRPADVLPR